MVWDLFTVLGHSEDAVKPQISLNNSAIPFKTLSKIIISSHGRNISFFVSFFFFVSGTKIEAEVDIICRNPLLINITCVTDVWLYRTS